ncbi:cobalamin biosynthesis protein CbiG [Acetobacter lambici]|uniref:Cobalamin biosynthesis protein n=1 Tax=Acetobacter lambici TaxID=1332824 RepID=A0ABT1F0Z5_9PROT|nr:cobalamin biosynthesis protein [Acetobacter lambici]MCP1242648.1 cobalamin biosynthesis protein [Acetobacter lambici]MCP1258863.1 cobalamin biosynthesis protein [Acetobacter lambici]NHO57171.1 cobalamin biosynthesis protein CbiG [Acetobacter lambici]
MIVVGMGWRKVALPEHALELVARSLHRLGAGTPDYIAVPDFKNTDDLPHAVARMWGAGVLWVSRAQLQQMQASCPTGSATVMGHVGVASVAEACALAGAGAGTRLCLPRQVFCGVTCAVAEGD